MAVRLSNRGAGETKTRILNAAEHLFIECGCDAMSLRQITAHANVNLAAVNYHFGSKAALIHAMLARRLTRLSHERLTLLKRLDTQRSTPLNCEQVLGALFIPALRLAQQPDISGPAFLRLLGRAYTDPSPFVHDFLNKHDAPLTGRFFDAFQRALPHLPRKELSWRLHFAMSALCGILVHSHTDKLIAKFSDAQTIDDPQSITRLTWFIVAALQAPVPQPFQLSAFSALLSDMPPLRNAQIHQINPYLVQPG